MMLWCGLVGLNAEPCYDIWHMTGPSAPIITRIDIAHGIDTWK